MEQKTNRRIGVLGGSFDPVHMGHLAMAEEALRAARLDRVFLMVAPRPPHKTLQASPEDRLTMARLAVRNRTGMEASDFEWHLPGTSYMAATMAALHRAHPADRLFFLAGEDALESMTGWYKKEELFALAEILYFPRPSGADGRRAAAYLERACGARVRKIDGPLPDVSASEIRRKIGTGLSIDGLTPDIVRHYIEDHKLYQ